MFEESGILRQKRKYNNVLGLNKTYIIGFSFSYNSFISSENKKKLLIDIVIDKKILNKKNIYI